MNHKMPILTAERHADLFRWLIGQRDACDELHGDECTDERCVISKIALAALTADNVAVMDHSGAYYDFSRKYDTSLPNGIYSLYTAPPVPVMQAVKLDAKEKLCIVCDYYYPAEYVREAIRAAGGTVEGE